MKNKTANKSDLIEVSDLITDCQCDIEIAENALQMILLSNTSSDEGGHEPANIYYCFSKRAT
ncbi:hypothetical protein ABRP56_09120 [Pectobacterium odoriferum]|uniref:hypothetical protein n=1 Tax=Pectobacterium odoriferum TaxID=78398 RepID=UPI0032ED4811